MTRIQVIVNPQAGRGHAATLTPRIHESFKRLGADYSIVHTSGPGDGRALARDAITDGVETIVAVGGDGTSHEILNGMMDVADGEPIGNLAWIRGGSGNDFAAASGAPVDVDAACRLVVQGATRVVDVGKVVIDGELTRYFDNVVGIGFDGLVSKETRNAKKARGLALYLPAVLRTIFVTMYPMRVAVTLDDEELDVEPMMIAVVNGPREGGGFIISPEAKLDDGLLDVLVVDNASRMQMLGLVPRFLKGTHLSHEKVSLRTARRVHISSDEPLHFHVDGEVLCDVAHDIAIEVVPSALRILVPSAT